MATSLMYGLINGASGLLSWARHQDARPRVPLWRLSRVALAWNHVRKRAGRHFSAVCFVSTTTRSLFREYEAITGEKCGIPHNRLHVSRTITLSDLGAKPWHFSLSHGSDY